MGHGRCGRLWLVLACLGAPASGQDVVLEWASGPPETYRSSRIVLGARPPSGVNALLFEAPRYGAADWAGGARLIVAADAARLWVDRDFDGDLGDERSVSFTRSGTRRHVTMDLFVPLRRNRPPDRIRCVFYGHAQERADVLRFAALVHRAGTVVLAGRERRIALYDRNGDLHFDDPETDRLYVDLDGDGALDRRPGSAERIRAGRPFHLGGLGFLARVPVGTGDRIRFAATRDVPAPPRRPWRTDEEIPPAGREARPGTRPFGDLTRDYRELTARGRDGTHAAAYRRATVLAAIGELGTRRAFTFLNRIARTDPSFEIRAAAVLATGYAAYAPLAAQIAALARTARSRQVRVAAMRALHGMEAFGREDTYGRVLRSAKHHELVDAAARHLAYTQRASAFRVLDEAVSTLRPAELRYHAYVAATRFRPLAPPTALVLAGAREPDPRLQTLALKDAFAIGLPETRALALAAVPAAAGHPPLLLAVVEILGALGDARSVDALLPLTVDATPTVRGRLVDLLRPVRDPAAVAVLLQALDAPHAATRSLAADVLAAIPDPQVPVALAARLGREGDTDVLRALMRAAGERGATVAAAPIVKAAQIRSEDRSVQHAALRALGRIGIGARGALEFFAERAGDSDWQMRVFALDVLAETRDPAAANLLAACLGADAWQVRLAAAQGLGVVRVPASVPLLIERLRVESNRRIRRAVGTSLFRLTGQNLYDVAELWARWWDERETSFRMAHEAPEPPREPGPGRSVATFYGVPVESDRVVFVIDQSGSMATIGSEHRGGDGAGPTRLERAVAETLRVVARLDPGARVNVLLFATEVHRWRKGLARTGRKARASLRGFLDGQRPGGGTNLYEALESAILTEEADTIYVLSDGYPSAGRFLDEKDILREIHGLNRLRRIAIHCVAVGHDSPLLRRLAEDNGGSYARR